MKPNQFTTPDTSDAVRFQGIPQSNSSTLLSALRSTDAHLRSGVIAWNSTSGDLKWKVDITIEANYSSNITKISCDWPKILLNPDFFLATEIEKDNMKEDSPAIASPSEALKLALIQRIQDTPKSQKRTQISFKIKCIFKCTLSHSEIYMTDGADLDGLVVVIIVDEVETKHISTDCFFSLETFSPKHSCAGGFNSNNHLFMFSLALNLNLSACLTRSFMKTSCLTYSLQFLCKII